MLPIDPKGRKQALILILGLICAGWYVGKMYMLDPRQAALDGASAALARLEGQNGRARTLIAEHYDLDEQVELQERQLKIFEEFIPESEEVPELLDAISREAQLIGVELRRLRPLTAAAEEYYTRQTWELAVLGEYHDVGRYLGRIASLPRVIKPAGVNIVLAPGSRATRGMGTPLEVTLRIETFVLADPAGAGTAQRQGV